MEKKKGEKTGKRKGRESAKWNIRENIDFY